MHAAISFLYTLTPCFLASWLLPHNYFLTESKSSSSVLNIFNCATRHSSCPSIFLPPLLHGSIVTSFQFLDCCSCASMLLPSLSWEPYSMVSSLLSSPSPSCICSPFTAEELQTLTSLLPMTEQVSCARHCSDMGDSRKWDTQVPALRYQPLWLGLGWGWRKTRYK